MSRLLILCACVLLCPRAVFASDDPAELILYRGKIVTVDEDFSIAEAVAIRGDRILAVGTNEQILELANDDTDVVDLKGKTVLPGLIDSHVHATGASTYEFDHVVPDVETIADVLTYIQTRVDAAEDGDWIRLEQIFITRLVEQRFPTRAELDRVAPNNPVIYRTGPDLAVNSLALELSGIDEDYTLPADSSGRIERDSNGRLNGIIRGASGIVRDKSSKRQPTTEQRLELLEDLLSAYNAVGITSISDRNASDSAIGLYQQLLDDENLTCRVYLYYAVNAQSDPEQIRRRIESAADHHLHAYSNRLWLRGVKVFLDGGMLTGSAYMREPWGVSEIYSIIDPQYRGTLKIQPERLFQISKLALENDLQMTAHAVGDGAVENLINAYSAINETMPIAALRPCITHCNFMSEKSIERMASLGIVADLQPAWLYLDGATLTKQFGVERTRYFQPYRSIFDAGVVVGGGSDHMQKIGDLRSVNPYNPFLGMWITLTRQARRFDGAIHPQERITREQALRLYTINNAYLTFEEKEKGSIEPGKLADMIVVDRDYLACPLEEVKDIQVLQTYLGGEAVYTR